MPGYRQEVFNVLLAQVLQERGVVSAPEQILHVKGHGRKMPDVIVNFRGLRTAIEGEIGYRPNAYQLALQSAQQRVEQGIAHIGIAVVYPEHLGTLDFQTLQTQFAQTEFRKRIAYRHRDHQSKTMSQCLPQKFLMLDSHAISVQPKCSLCD